MTRRRLGAGALREVAAIAVATLVVAMVGGSCAKQAPRTPRRSVLVRFAVEPGAAEIWIDGRSVGTARDVAGGVNVPVGRHEIEIALAGHFPYWTVVELAAPASAAAASTTVAATLFPVVP